MKSFFVKHKNNMWMLCSMCLIAGIAFQIGTLRAQLQSTSQIVVNNVPSNIAPVSEAAAAPEAPIKDLESLKPIAQNTDTGAKAYVASKTGTKYYPQDCKAVNRIKQENRVYFKTEIEAQKAGLELSSSCKNE